MSRILQNAPEPSTSKDQGEMRAIRLDSPRRPVLHQVRRRDPNPTEVEIRIEGCGLCASGIPVWQGRDWFEYPREPGEPGHEGWGVVERVGAQVKDFRPGDRVTAISYHAFAEYDYAPENAVVQLPDFLRGLPFPGEPLGCAMNIFDRSDIRHHHTVAIIGIGFLGALLVQLAKSSGATVIALSKREYSLDVAAKCGADRCVKLEEHQAVIDQVKDLTDGKFCDRVIEATGAEWPLNLAIELTRIRGRLMVAGFHQGGMRNVNMQLLNWRGIDLINTHEREVHRYVQGIKEAIVAVGEERMDPFWLLTHRVSMDEISEGFELLENRPDGFVKAIMINE